MNTGLGIVKIGKDSYIYKTSPVEIDGILIGYLLKVWPFIDDLIALLDKDTPYSIFNGIGQYRALWEGKYPRVLIGARGFGATLLYPKMYVRMALGKWGRTTDLTEKPESSVLSVHMQLNKERGRQVSLREVAECLGVSINTISQAEATGIVGSRLEKSCQDFLKRRGQDSE